MVNAIGSASPFQLPAKTHLDTASASVFGMVFQENTTQFATLETAQAIAKMMGGSVVDLSEEWGGGSQTPQYAIKMGANGPVLNAGLIAARCESCGVEAGLSAALVEVGMMTGTPISASEALAKLQATQGNQTKPSTTKVAAETPAPVVTTSSAPATTTIVAPSVPAAVTIAMGSQPSTKSSGSVPDAKLADSAQQFEALLIGQMLKSVREESGSGWMGSDGGSSQVSAVEFGETQLAQAIASQGGLGLAQMVLKSLGPSAAKSPTTGS